MAWGAARPEEIVVTRRLYRDGQSDYLLNGVPSRLRDVVEFFLGTGVGSKAYAIIEQGRIGFIVSSRPEDRRGLIDEAAGITRYKSKKKAAERRMDSTRQHLLRVTDIVGEIEGRLRSLRLQAQKAERYKRYKGELRDLDLWSSSQRFLGHLADEKSAIAELAEVRERHDLDAAALAVEEAGVEAERLAGAEEANELATAKDDLFALSNRAQLGMQRAAHHESEASELTSRAEAGRKEVEELRARAIARGADVEEISAQLSEIDGDAERREREYDQEARLQDVRRVALIEARGALDGAVGEMASASARLARLGAERTAAMQRREDLAARLEGLAGEEEAANERLSELTSDESEFQERVLELRERVEARAGGPPRKMPSWRRCAPSSGAASWSWRPCARSRTGDARGWRRFPRSRSDTRASRRAFAPSCRSTSKAAPRRASPASKGSWPTSCVRRRSWRPRSRRCWASGSAT